MLGVVDEEARLLLVALQKVLGGDVQRLGHALADGNAGHDDDELAPAVQLVQFEDGLDVAVGLARAGFHLDVEVDRGHLGLDQGIREWQILPSLHGVDVAQQSRVRKGEVGIAESRFLLCRGIRRGFQRQRPLWAGRCRLADTGVEEIADAAVLRILPLEAVHHRLHGGGLVGLGLELQLHKHPSSFVESVGTTKHVVELNFSFTLRKVSSGARRHLNVSEHISPLHQVDQLGEAQGGQTATTACLQLPKDVAIAQLLQ